MGDFVLEEAGEATERKTGRGSDGDDDDASVDLDATHIRATTGAGRSSDHDDALARPNAHGRKPPGEKRPEVFGVIA